MVDWPDSSGHISGHLLDLVLWSCPWLKWHQCKFIHWGRKFERGELIRLGHQSLEDNTIGFPNLLHPNTRNS